MKNISTASSEELMLQARGYCSLNALFPKTTGCVVFSAEDGKNSLTKFVINDQELYSHRVRITSLGIMDVLLFTDNFGVGFKAPTDTSKPPTCRRGKTTHLATADKFLVKRYFLPKQELRLGDCV